jgi:serine/threonine protein kinase
MLFEFLVGVPPFYGDTPGEVFVAILEHNLEIPEEVDEVSEDLIRKLLDPNPSTRLGANDARDIMRHPFFTPIDWETLRSRPAPFIPSLTSSEDTTYFDPRSEFFGQAEPTTLEEALATLDEPTSGKGEVPQRQFGDFWFVSAENLAALNRVASQTHA